ncbi:MAG: MarR family transcriptional regulator [Calditrichaeota bacterium]|nr:MarR family transcriptional regulator [Calditrichota bacterium]
MTKTKDIHQRFARSFRITMHTLHNLAWKISKTGEFSLAQYRLLMLLTDKGPMTVSEFKQYIGVAQSTASELVSRLVDQGYIVKKKSEEDRRKTIFELTAKAKEVLGRRRKEMEIIYQKVLDTLSQEDQLKLVEAFETIAELLIIEEAKK